MSSTKSGKGYLIGAGPGDPQLLTLRAADALRESSIILIDELVDPAVFLHAFDLTTPPRRVAIGGA